MELLINSTLEQAGSYGFFFFYNEIEPARHYSQHTVPRIVFQGFA